MCGHRPWPDTVPTGYAAVPEDTQESFVDGQIQTVADSAAAALCPILFLGKNEK